MSTTTEILFNSPALHSLKREQLVKLCKIHSIKANGKNVDLIQKLRQHAQTLPKDNPLSIAARSEEHGPIPMQLAPVVVADEPTDAMDTSEDEELLRDDPIAYHNARTRPSEQWEMVMESIEELEEGSSSSQGTLTSQRTLNALGGTGEFGTANSKSSSTVGSSIKALATSLGLKRNTSSKSSTASSKHSINDNPSSSNSNATFPPPLPSDEAMDVLTQTSTPYSSLPPATSLPQTDHFTLDTNNRLSLGGASDMSEDTGEPLPGHALRPGVPAPANARLSMGYGLTAPSTPARKSQPTTTIRLISNPLDSQANSSSNKDVFATPQLKPFNTTFDITFGSPLPTPNFSGFGFGKGVTRWPPPNPDDEDDDGDRRMKGIYPTLTFSDLPPTVEVKPRVTGDDAFGSKPTTTTPTEFDSLEPKVNDSIEEDEDVAMPGALFSNPPSNLAVPAPTSPVSASPSNTLAPPKSPQPFIFGSPHHKVTNEQFSATAASVIEEMNQRLREEGVAGIDLGIIEKLHRNAKPREIRPLPGSARKSAANGTNTGEIANKFAKMHEVEFSKMEGIDSVVKRRERMLAAAANSNNSSRAGTPQEDAEKVVLGKKRKSSAIEAKPRRSSVAPKKVGANGTRVVSGGKLRVKPKVAALPGAFDFGNDDDDDEADEADVQAAERGGKRVRMDPEAPPSVEPSLEEQKAEEARLEEKRLELEKEKEAIKKKLEANRARRRSSAIHGGRKSGVGRVSGVHGRTSMGRPRQSLVKPKPKPSRFGFLSTAKNIVQSVWGRGKPPASAAPAGTTGAGSSTVSKPASKAEPVAPVKEKMGPPSFMPTRKAAAAAPAKPTSTVASGSKPASAQSTASSSNKLLKPNSTTSTAGTTSLRSRSPLPSFSPTGTTTASTRTSRMSSIASSSNAATAKSRTSTANVSSIGAKLTSKMSPPGSTVGSMGTKNSVGTGRASVASRTSTAHASGSGTGSSSSRLSRMSTSSRLFAPTASSLAKMNRNSVAGSSTLKGVAENVAQEKQQPQAALESITNSPVVAGVVSPASTAMSPGTPARPMTFSPLRHGGGIFSKPLVLPFQSGIPTPVKKKSGEVASPPSGTAQGSSATNPTGTTKVRSLNGRKPRISRSKVIARLASQRAAGTSSSAAAGASGASGSGSRPGMGPRSSSSSSGVGKTRSSLGAKVSRPRASYGGGGNLVKGRVSSVGSTASGNSVLMSAKRKARQSEYARRRSSRVRGQLVGSSPVKAPESSVEV
ncbi:hypothetical protein D9613_011118 [Agrocybe pediades]|uniref:SAP domain-containing protein n=1 Tax=Agrocybe pediades TaxID=84607 RepID=A0A8H4QL74_9AGAR|nr:hypothetical protein D9613_011118 [Agrocybe pediades]